jgi:hypothetical protein
MNYDFGYIYREATITLKVTFLNEAIRCGWSVHQGIIIRRFRRFTQNFRRGDEWDVLNTELRSYLMQRREGAKKGFIRRFRRFTQIFGEEKNRCA